VVLATPLSLCRDRGRDRPALKPGAIVTDSARSRGGDPRHRAGFAARRAFRPGHPVAGTEHSGPEAGFAEMFHDRWCILTRCRTPTRRRR